MVPLEFTPGQGRLPKPATSQVMTAKTEDSKRQKRNSVIAFSVAVLFLIAFLLAPGFTDFIRGDGTREMMPGYATILWHLTLIPSAVVHPNIESLIIVAVGGIPALFILWSIVLVRADMPRRSLTLAFCAFFSGVSIAVIRLLFAVDVVALGGYFLLVATVFGVGSCIVLLKKEFGSLGARETPISSGHE